jgi:hypothetical protein
MNAALRADLAEAAAVVLTGQINLAEATTSLVAIGRLTSWHRSSPTSQAGRSPHREADEDEGIMTMIGPLVRVGIFEHQTDDLERVLGHSSTSLRAAVTAILQSRS